MKVLSTAGSTMRHTTVALLEALVILAIVGALVLGTAALGGVQPAGADSVFAARGGNGGASIWIESSSLRAADGTLEFGDPVAFGYRSDRAESIQLQCSRSGALVFAASQMLAEGASTSSDAFTLGPSLAWTEGGADCTGKLGHRSNSGRYVVEASVTFVVAP